MGGNGRGIGRLAQRDSFAVGAQHHDLRARGRCRRRPGGLVAGHCPGQGPRHRLQTGDRLLQTQDALQHSVDLTVGILHHQGLIPVPQQIRAPIRRQSQPRIQRRRLNPLAFPRAVDHPLQEEVPKNRLIRPVVGFGQPLDHPPVGQGQRLAAVAVARQGKIRGLQVVTQPQQVLPQATFQLVRRQPVSRGVGHEARQLRQARGDVQRLAFHSQRRHPQHRWVPRVNEFVTFILPASASSRQGEPTPNPASHRYPRARLVTPINYAVITKSFILQAIFFQGLAFG